MRYFVRWFAFLSSVFVAGLASAAPQLYETGPAEESAYVRFVNATGGSISIHAAKGAATVRLDARAEGRVSNFFRVKSGTRLSAIIKSKTGQVQVDVVGKTEQYITIAVLPDGNARIITRVVSEMPDDFNAMRSSLALFNLDESCSASMQGGAKRTSVFVDVKPLTVQRRLINPVKLTVATGCTRQADGAELDMSQLEAGARYSVFLLPSGMASRAFFVRDIR